jgi:hypothetical protein
VERKGSLRSFAHGVEEEDRITGLPEKGNESSTRRWCNKILFYVRVIAGFERVRGGGMETGMKMDAEARGPKCRYCVTNRGSTNGPWSIGGM